MGRATVLSAVVLLSCALGCGPSKRDVTGSWTGHAAMDPDIAVELAEEAKKAGKKDVTAEQIEAYYQTVVSSVTFSDDTTYIMVVGINNFQGTWTIKGNEVFMMVSTMNGDGRSYGFGGYENGESRSAMLEKSGWLFKLSKDKKTLTGTSWLLRGVVVQFQRT